VAASARRLYQERRACVSRPNTSKSHIDVNPGTPIAIKQEIRRLERRLKRLRLRLKISDRNAVIALYDGDLDERIAVEADGLGGARVVRAEGNYPVDYSTRDERFFRNGDTASRAAHCLSEGDITSLSNFDLRKTYPCEQ